MSLYEQNKAEHTASAADAGKNKNGQGGSTTNWRPRTPGGNILDAVASQSVSTSGRGPQTALAVSKGVR